MNDDTHIKLINQTLDAVYDALDKPKKPKPEAAMTDTPAKKIDELIRVWLEESEYDPEYAETLAMLKKALPHKFEPDHIVPVQVSNPKTKLLAVDYDIKMTYKDSHGRSTEAFITVDIYGQICDQDISATRECPAEGRSIDGMRVMAWRIHDGWGEEEVPLPDEIIEAIENDILENRGKCDGE